MVSLGKFRHLTQCATPEGHFVVLAIDPRANLREALSAARGVGVGDAEVGEFKRDVVAALGDLCSGVLGDPAAVLGYGISSGLLRGTQGLITPVEVTNYAIHPSERDIQFIPGWNVEKAKRAGLSGVKLLLYFNPESPSVTERMRLVGLLTSVCARYDIPLFLEPVLFPLQPGTKMDTKTRVRYSVQMARIMAEAGADILKLEFPVDPSVDRDPEIWEDALGRLNDACGTVPWVLLSGGVEASMFSLQATAACKAGSSGVMVGRALWNPAIKASAGGTDGRISILQSRSRHELISLTEIVHTHGTPFWQKTGRPTLDLNWYEVYPGINGSK